MKPDDRYRALRDAWMKHGCPEHMIVNVKSTGERIELHEGSVILAGIDSNGSRARQEVAKPPSEVLLNGSSRCSTSCEVCGRPLRGRQRSLCSRKCRNAAGTAKRRIRMKEQAEEKIKAFNESIKTLEQRFA